MKSQISALFLTLALAVQVKSDVFAYECTAYPELAGFQQDFVTHRAERWIDDSWLVHFAGYLAEPFEPQMDSYRRFIPEFAGAASFFVEWRMQTDGDRAGIPAGSPAILTASGTMGIRYHFTIARDQARLIDPYLNVILFEIQPDVPHVFRLEVRGTAWSVFIDGGQVNTGVAPRTYPTSDSRIVFGTIGWVPPATTRWDYIRFGVIPDDAGPGDLNCDGTINPFDIVPFVSALSDADQYGRDHPACQQILADIDLNGSVNQFDIPAFINLLIQ